MTSDAVADALHRALDREPGQNKRQLARALAIQGFHGYGPRDVNRLVYRDPRFACDDSTPPRWRVSASATTAQGPDRESKKIRKKRKKVAELRRRADEIRRALEAPEPVRHSPSSTPVRAGRPVSHPPGNPTEYAGPPPRLWQKEALDAWLRHGRRAIVEAVTGTGKSLVGILAAWEALGRGEKVLVLVPTADLQDQWFRELTRALPGASIGLRGDGSKHTLSDCDILVSIINSAHETDLLPARRPALVIADEVHRYGAAKFARALREGYAARLGLTATLERSDEGVDGILKPYFGPVLPGCDFRRGLRDDVLASFRVGFVPVEFDTDEQDTYDSLTDTIGRLTHVLTTRHHAASAPYSAFMQDVVRLQASYNLDAQASKLASQYLRAVRERRDLLAETDAKLDALERLAPALELATNGLVFTLTKRGSEQAADALQDAGLSAQWFHSELRPAERKARLADFRERRVQVLTAPKVLDEGVDVPAADTAVILAASRGRRQMVQRMGRILRRKDDGRHATFVVVYVAGTSEDPDQGAHEAFLEDLLDLASDVRTFDVECDEDEVVDWFTTTHERRVERRTVEVPTQGRRALRKLSAGVAS